MISRLDRKIIGLISRDIPLVARPFEKLAHKLGIEEHKLIERVKAFKKSGVLRKYSTVLNHRKVGFNYNAMAAWDVPDRLIKKAGSAMACYKAVSHCYERKRNRSWNYNLYSMIHGKTKKECLDVVKDISKKTGISDYKVLFSSKEYKKTGVKYDAD